MVRIEFASSIQRHSAIPVCEVQAPTVSQALEAAFESHPQVRGYVLDDRGGVRKHIAIFVNDQAIADRTDLSDALQPNDRIYIMQALSGG